MVPGFVVMERKWLLARFVEAAWVAELVFLMEEGDIGERYLGFAFKAVVEEAVALVAADNILPCLVLGEAVDFEDFLRDGSGEEDAAAAVGHGCAVCNHPVYAFGEGADVVGFCGRVFGEFVEEGRHGGEEGVVVD